MIIVLGIKIQGESRQGKHTGKEKGKGHERKGNPLIQMQGGTVQALVLYITLLLLPTQNLHRRHPWHLKQQYIQNCSHPPIFYYSASFSLQPTAGAVCKLSRTGFHHVSQISIYVTLSPVLISGPRLWVGVLSSPLSLCTEGLILK